VSAPRLLDLFCCAGGAGMGYHRAGFEVVGVDIAPQRHYPFEFIEADAIAYVLEHGHEFDVIHASPPCQAYSITANAHDVQHPDLLEPTREALREVGRPYIIENVVGAPLLDPVMLCATMFGLRALDVDGVELQLQRHRLFETSFPIALAPAPCVHDGTPIAGSYKGSRHRKPEHRDNPARRGGYTPAVPVRGALLGIDWMNEHELAQAIPPAYTEWLGRQLLAHLALEGEVAS
jgi:DNA (cytosine-5)-methyltransferase 1